MTTGIEPPPIRLVSVYQYGPHVECDARVTGAYSLASGWLQPFRLDSHPEQNAKGAPHGF